MVDLHYLVSTCKYSHLLDAFKGNDFFEPVYHTATMKEIREEMKKKKLLLRMIYSGKLDKNGIRRLNYLKEKGV